MSLAKDSLAQGVEVLVQKIMADDAESPDVVIIGSGYGGAVAASRLARARRADGSRLKVWLLERGREFVAGDFPSSIADLPAEVRMQGAGSPHVLGNRSGLYDFHFQADISVLSGNGLGGGSLINASVAERVTDQVWQDSAWPGRLRSDAPYFDKYYQRVEEMLQVKPLPSEAWPQKTRQLQALCEGMKRHPDQEQPGPVFRPVHLALNQKDNVNPWQIEQLACIGCGDCFSGCNFNARNSLNLNYLPDARQHGAEMFTGVTVHFLRRNKDHWEVHFGPTDLPHVGAHANRQIVRTGQVILAAGSLGSTEILLRSRAEGMHFSPRLGDGFSANGDMIWAGWRQRQEVHVCSEEHIPFDERKVGPTITAMLDARAQSAHPYVIQDAAVPASMQRLFGELVTTSSMLYRMEKWDRPFDPRAGRDPDAVQMDELRHTALYLSMGKDDAQGKICYVGPARSGEIGYVKLHWPQAGKQILYRAVEQQLQPGVEELGGMLITNPAWRAYPKNLSAALSGKKPDGNVLTVHPLGGCIMGDHAEQAVVNHRGAVFCGGRENRAYPGLYVWDGAAIPCALGINPFLTIAALAERAVALWAQKNHCTIDYNLPAATDAQSPSPSRQDSAPSVPLAALEKQDGNATTGTELPSLQSLHIRSHSAPPRPKLTVLTFQEEMKGKLSFGRKEIEAVLEVNFVFNLPVMSFLQNPLRELRIDNAILHLEDGRHIALHGCVKWLQLQALNNFSKCMRAMYTYAHQRGRADLYVRLREQLRERDTFIDDAEVELGSGWRYTVLPDAFKKISDILRLASHTGNLRLLEYELTPQRPGPATVLDGQENWQLYGCKRVEYKEGNNLWDSLSDLKVQVKRLYQTTSGQTRIRECMGRGMLRLQWLELFKKNKTQLAQAQNNVYAFQDLASMAGFFLRAIFRIHFWSLRKPDYPRKKRSFPRPGALPGLQKPEWYAVPVKTRHEDDEKHKNKAEIRIELTHYCSAQPEQIKPELPPLMLIHGFGASGLQYTTDLLPVNLVQYLCQQGRHVWVLELRTSIALSSSHQQWKMDDVARQDIAAAVHFVLRHAHGKFEAIDVLAHCIGSAMFNIAVLSGSLQGTDGKSLIRAAVMLQVAPFFTVSCSNQVRAQAAKQGRDWINFDMLDSSMDEESATWQDMWLDRILALHPLPESERLDLQLGGFNKPRVDIANYMRSTAVFGRLFAVSQLSEAMRNALGDLLGHTNMTTYRQILHSVLAGRLMDQYGRNLYVTDENFARYYRFPALFVHGMENDVFAFDGIEQSLKKLHSLFGEQAFKYLRLRGYGHLDPLVGKNAARDVFDKLAHFLNHPPPCPSLPNMAAEARWLRKAPKLGPVLGWRRPAEHGAILQRLWFKVDEGPEAVDLVETFLIDDAEQVVPGSYQQHALLREPGFVLAVCDVLLPPKLHAARIICCSRHYLHPLLLPASIPPEADVPEMPLPHEIAAALEKAAATSLIPAANDEKMCTGEWRRAPEQFSCTALHPAVLRQEQATKGVCFALSSCRYSGTPMEEQMGERAYLELLEALDSAVNLSHPGMDLPGFMLLMGDQIYVDATAGVLERQKRLEVFLERYQAAYESPVVRKAYAAIPSYMMLDDHEINNDWGPEHRRTEHQRDWGQMGQAAFLAFQWAHGPRNAQAGKHLALPDLRRRHQPPPARHLWYQMQHKGMPFFMLDTRLERGSREIGMDLEPDGSEQAGIISNRQMEELRAWLHSSAQHAPEQPKFIVSPSALAPIAANQLDIYRRRNDGWHAYPASLAALCDAILASQAKHVVILAGDLHASFACRMQIEDSQGRRAVAHTVVVSPLYAPYPFANVEAGDMLTNYHDHLELDGNHYQLHVQTLWEDDEYQGFGILQVLPAENGAWRLHLRPPQGEFSKPFPAQGLLI